MSELALTLPRGWARSGRLLLAFLGCALAAGAPWFLAAELIWK